MAPLSEASLPVVEKTLRDAARAGVGTQRMSEAQQMAGRLRQQNDVKSCLQEAVALSRRPGVSNSQALAALRDALNAAQPFGHAWGARTPVVGEARELYVKRAQALRAILNSRKSSLHQPGAAPGSSVVDSAARRSAAAAVAAPAARARPGQSVAVARPTAATVQIHRRKLSNEGRNLLLATTGMGSGLQDQKQALGRLRRLTIQSTLQQSQSLGAKAGASGGGDAVGQSGWLAEMNDDPRDSGVATAPPVRVLV